MKLSLRGTGGRNLDLLVFEEAHTYVYDEYREVFKPVGSRVPAYVPRVVVSGTTGIQWECPGP